MKLNQYIEQAKKDPLEGGLSFSSPPPQRHLITTKKGRASLPYWYGIKPIRFIWRGNWADPEICYNRMVVNSHIVEDSMYERYREYCNEEDFESTDDGFAEFMRNNKAEIVELIYMAHKAEKEQLKT